MKMKGLLMGFATLALIGMAGKAEAQDAKADAKKLKKEAKAWKSKLKEMPDKQFLAMIDEYDVLKNEQKGLEKQIEALGKQVEQVNADMSKAVTEIEKVKANCTPKKKTDGGGTPAATDGVLDPGSEKLGANVTTDGKEDDFKTGTVFKVQVGAFRNKDLQKYLDIETAFEGDIDQDGSKKYTIGFFRDYWQADNFKKLLRTMGMEDAWIVAYVDNKRQSIGDVIGEAEGEGKDGKKPEEEKKEGETTDK